MFRVDMAWLDENEKSVISNAHDQPLSLTGVWNLHEDTDLLFSRLLGEDF
jgi:hypothetical protein